MVETLKNNLPCNQRTPFSLSREIRNRFCKNKDEIITPILNGLDISKPLDFRAILMPSLYGPEAFFLVEKGVLPNNIFAIEDNRAEFNYHGSSHFNTHKEIVECTLPDRQELKGMRTTGKPADVGESLDQAYWTFKDRHDFNLIYIDLLSQLDFKNHYKDVFCRIFGSKMLKQGSVLIVTSGNNRCHLETSEFNKDFVRICRENNIPSNRIPNEGYILSAMAESKSNLILKELDSKSYRSKPSEESCKLSKIHRGALEYLTTVAKF